MGPSFYRYLLLVGVYSNSFNQVYTQHIFFVFTDDYEFTLYYIKCRYVVKECSVTARQKIFFFVGFLFTDPLDQLSNLLDFCSAQC